MLAKLGGSAGSAGSGRSRWFVVAVVGVGRWSVSFGSITTAGNLTGGGSVGGVLRRPRSGVRNAGGGRR